MTEQEFKELFNKYFDQLRNYILYSCGDEALASDIVQECFIKIWNVRSTIDLSTITSLLYTIVSNHLKSVYRHKKVSLKFELDYKPQQTSPTPEEVTIYNETRRNFEAIVNKMPDKQRIVFMMSRIDGLKNKEIAERLDIALKTVEKRMTNALQLLSAKLLIH